MKVVAFNGSSGKNGNTSILIRNVLDVLGSQGIETEPVQVAGYASSAGQGVYRNASAVPGLKVAGQPQVCSVGGRHVDRRAINRDIVAAVFTAVAAPIPLGADDNLPVTDDIP